MTIETGLLLPILAYSLAAVSAAPKTAWKLLTKGISAAEARQQAEVTGNEAMVVPIFGLVTVLG